jgi:oligoribonuclease (3'-5' exoribonuclease)
VLAKSACSSKGEQIKLVSELTYARHDRSGLLKKVVSSKRSPAGRLIGQRAERRFK